ncbi:BCCT family transporter [Vibrio gazogenes]|uniref:BCCT, betaine/carnitine/choline family transporter n=1 Tax=Vibrio gazogenes DSM 21264 = NBRC 103151 TaxID=1123492 RepID=A0A1M4Z8R4_VIBGA|nr:BCCT family transporter [Vibrio gazogenes]USP12485.1 BCCT family transporter [Vibrio gazogenes]SHF14411.1 BCCT, betaine/carnitine/choline family transporter [Vibrio gazogenes DSM 21264] [Vibrio gazogenes DSM 21264 = NBRC 103151]SJN53918.1 Glycine betaine transporter BetL [Vibrio gazogenes]
MNNLNFGLTIPAIILVLLLLVVSSLYPDLSQAMAGDAMTFVTNWFGWLVQLGSLALVFFLFWLAFSKYGAIRLGDDKPEYSNFSYGGMIFTAGVGASLIYWGIGEPMYNLQSPPLFADANSYTAAAWSVTYSMFHWGITGWAIYCFPAIPFSYAFYVQKKRTLKLSTLCEPVLGKNPIVAKCIDLVAIFGTLAAFASSLALTVTLLSEGVSQLFEIENNLMLQGSIILLFVLVLFVVMLVGFNRGISKVSDYTVVAAICFALFVLFTSNAPFILNNVTDSFGVMLDSYFRMSLWTDPVQQSGFPQSWTQYYWFWYYAYLIMMGLFITRISRGRTIREVILYTIFMGSLGCAFFISIFGGYAVWAQLLGGYPVQDWMSEGGLTFAVVSLIQTLPAKNVILAVFLVIQFFLMLTTMSSASVATAMLTTNQLSLRGDPDNKVKLMWAGAIALISFSVFLCGGGIDTIKSLCVVAGLPMMFVYAILVKQLLMQLSNGQVQQGQSEELVEYQEFMP